MLALSMAKSLVAAEMSPAGKRQPAGQMSWLEEFGKTLDAVQVAADLVLTFSTLLARPEEAAISPAVAAHQL
jgi:hypothetical protein